MYIEKVSRSTRVSAQIKKEMTNVLRGAKFASKYTTVNISRVDVSKDLKNAKIYYTSFQDVVEISSNEIIDFNRDIPQIRYELAKAINMKYIPKISFHNDKALVAEHKLNSLLDDIVASQNDNE